MRTRPSLPRHDTGRLGSRAGLSLLEVVIVASILLLLLSSAILAADGGLGAFRSPSNASDLEGRVRRTLDRVATEMLSAGESELQPSPEGQFGTSDLTYRKALELNGTAIVWGAQERLAFEYESGELDDGLDNNGNGLIDEGVLVFTRDVGGTDRRIVLCHGVSEYLAGETFDGDDNNGNGVTDEAGFNVHQVGNLLHIRLSLEEADETAGVIQRTLETTLRLRN